MNATEYNQSMIGRLWTLADLPKAWPGAAILSQADLDRDGDLEAHEFPGVEWIRFESEVREFQTVAGLTVDGKLGRNTLSVLKNHFGVKTEAPILARIGMVGFPQASEPTAVPKNLVEGHTPEERKIAGTWNTYGREIAFQADAHGIPVEVALAVFAVEAGGRAYDPRIGLIIIRVETPGRYPNGEPDFRQKYGTGQAAEWRALTEWAQRDLARAFSKTSWGLPQLMGFNHLMTTFDSPVSMAVAFQVSVIHQIGGFFGFIEHNHLVDSILREDWREFTRRYNGSGQVDNYSGVLTSFLSAARTMQQNGAAFGL